MQYEIVSVDDTRVKARGNCRVTGKVYETAPFDEYAWCVWCMTAEPIQNTGLVELSADDREFLISATSPEGWKQLFGDEHDC